MNLSPLRSLLHRSTPFPRLSDPVLALGSAPDATIPEDADQFLLATVNGSQASQKRIPDLTLMGTGVMRNKPVNKEAKVALRNHRTRHLVHVRSSQLVDRSRPRMAWIGYSYDRFTRISEAVRAEAMEQTTGIKSGTIWPSNGVFLVLLCLSSGAPFVVMTGFSFSREGHAYNDKGRERAHREQDRHVLATALVKGAPIFTTDSAFSEESGVPLYRRETA